MYFLPRLLYISLKIKIFDRVDNRKIHSTSASRLGGASFLPAIAVTSFLTCIISDYFNLTDSFQLTNDSLLIICLAVIIYCVGIYDDIVGMRYPEKFFFQFLVATIAVLLGGYITNFNGLFGVERVSTFVGIPFTIFLIVFITNAINLIDGIDGLSSMLSIMAFALYGVMFYLERDYVDSMLCFASLGALAPFWHHNVFGVRRGISSKIFMGDGGALVIGFILSIMAIKLWNSSALVGEQYNYISDYSWIAAFTMLIIPCFDVLRVMLHRIKEHQPLFLPDKHHFHHKIMALGFTPRASLVILLIINVVFFTLNLVLATRHIGITTIVFLDVVLWLIIHITLSHKIKKLYNIK
ncbi:MAG: MraY family glycosyltransferase [Rikenellaceae bacterium]